MSFANQRLIAGDGIQIFSSVKDVELPASGSVILYTDEDKLTCRTLDNPTPRYVSTETPPVSVNAAAYQCARNDTDVLVDSTNHSQVNVVLPSNADIGKRITVYDATSTCLTHPIVVSSSTQVHHENEVLMNTNGMSLTFLFTGEAWLLI